MNFSKTSATMADVVEQFLPAYKERWAVKHCIVMAVGMNSHSTTAVAIATALDANNRQRNNGLRSNLRRYYPLDIITWSLPCPMNSMAGFNCIPK